MKSPYTRKLIHLATAAAIVAAPLTGLTAGSVFAAAPGSPLNLRLSPGTVTNDGMVVLTWEAPATSGVAYYQVYRYSGSATPGATELTYLGRTADNRTYFIDTAPTEGTFRYAVAAVNSSNEASAPTGWAAVTVDLPANGTGTITPDVTAPAAPATTATDAAYKHDRSVTVTWSGVTASDLWRYIVYRTENGGNPKMVGYADADKNSFTDTPAADGRFSYYVVAQDHTGNASAASPAAMTTVDLTAPTVQISAPVNGQTLLNSGSVTIAAQITENGAGYEASAVKYYLDGILLTSPVLNLSTLAIGNHTAKVEVTDRAGNTGSQQVQFAVSNVAVPATAPQNVTAPSFSKSRSVSVTWQAPASGTASKYIVYRTVNGVATVAGESTTTSFTDSVTADGTYSYHVVAVNGTTASPSSNVVAVVVDTVAPQVTISSPTDGGKYGTTGALPVTVNVSDATSGVEQNQVKLFLDGRQITNTSLDLSQMAQGEHTLKVEATDRAGNLRTQSVKFTVGTAQDGDEDHGPVRQDLIDKLYELRGQIQHGHFQSLLAKARNGNLKSFEEHVRKFQGKFISRDAAKQLLDMLHK